MEHLYQMIETIQAQLSQLKSVVEEMGGLEENTQITKKASEVGSSEQTEKGSVVEGVFNGQNMVGPDGKMYTVPANYASKSKLVEGDIMKLTITDDGSFIYKQIGPVKRKRQIASLVRDEETGSYVALVESGRSYRLLTASVSYYRGEPGDTVVILTPQEMNSKWAAVENIMKDPAEAAALDDFSVDEDLPLGDEMILEEGKSVLPSGSDMEIEGASAELPLGDDMELEEPSE